MANLEIACVKNHKIAINEELISYTQCINSIHLILKPELIQKFVEQNVIILVQEGSGFKKNCQVKCWCENNVGKYVPIGPSGTCAVAFALDKTILFGKTFGRKDKWGKQFDLHALVEARDHDTFYGKNVSNLDDKWQLGDDLKQRLTEIPDVHFASSDPHDRNFDARCFQWIDIINTSIPRDYQLETYRLALVNDVISVLPTGSGKTLTAIMLLSRMAILNKEHMGLVVVDRIPLVYQHANSIQEETDLRVICINSETNTKARIRAIIQKNCDVVVTTAGALKEQIERKRLSLQLFHTVVLDECHHATGSHAYSIIVKMLNTYSEAQRPRLLGLSASPFKVENDIKGKNEMQKFMMSFPGALLFRPRSIGSVKLPNIFWHQIHLTKIEMTFLSLVYSYVKENCAKFNLKLDSKWIESDSSIKQYLHQIQGKLRNYYYHNQSIKELQNTLTLIGSIEIAQVLGVTVATDLLRENILTNPPSWLKNDFSSSKSTRLLKLEEEIKMMIDIKNKHDSRMLVLTSTRECAKSLKKYLVNHYPLLNPAYIVGKKGADGMDWEEQKPILSSFNSGLCKMLVATSVLEEGLDVSACDHVVLFSGHFSLIRYIQSRGRARKEKSRFVVLTEESEDRLKLVSQQESMLYRLIDKENNTASYMNSLIKIDRVKWISEKYDNNEKVHQAIEERIGRVSGHLKIGEMSTILIIDKMPHISKSHLEESIIESIENTGLFDVKSVTEESNAKIIRNSSNAFGKDSLFYLLTIEDFKEGCRTSLDIFIDFCLNWKASMLDLGVNPYLTIPKTSKYIEPLSGIDWKCSVSFGRMTNFANFDILCTLQHDFSVIVENKRSLNIEADCTHSFFGISQGCDFHRQSRRTHNEMDNDNYIYDNDMNNEGVHDNNDFQGSRSILIKVNAIGSLGFGFVSVKQNELSIFLHLSHTPKFYKKTKRSGQVLSRRVFLNGQERLYIGESDFIRLKCQANKTKQKKILHYLSNNFDSELFVSDFTEFFGNSSINVDHYDFEVEWRINIIKSSRNVMIENTFEDLVHRYYKQDRMESRDKEQHFLIVDCLDFLTIPQRFLVSIEEQFYASYRAGKKFCTMLANGLKEPPCNWMYVKRLVFTPSRLIYFPAVLVKKSRILRNLPKEHFVFVTFRDEDLSKLNDLSLIRCIKKIITEGIVLCGEKYHFFCASGSQLREGKALFIRSASSDRLYELRNDILNLELQSYGNLKNVAKYMSRIGLYSTADMPLCKVEKTNVTWVDDIKSIKGTLLTDGAGKIKYSLLKKLGYEYASAIQFRLGGSKGILVKALDSDKEFDVSSNIVLRPSMKKFNSSDYQLTLVGVNKYMSLTLNREVINLLLSISRKNETSNLQSYLESMQDTFISGFCSRLENVSEAEVVLKPFIPQQYFKNITEFFDVREEPYWRSLLHHSINIDTKTLRQKTNIPVDKGCRLMGIPDPCNVLEPNEVCMNVISPDGWQETITGNVMIYRNPCLHPGDIRIKQAVRRPELSHWTNVLILPCSKSCTSSIADECSGGDLDGDIFSIIWDEKIVLSKSLEAAPCDYQSLSRLVPSNRIRACENPNNQAALAEMYERNLENDALGRVAHLHMALCDQLDDMALDPLAIELAKSQSVAVDFPKTGIEPEVPEMALELVRKNGYPDFMEKRDRIVYHSPKLIGVLYRKVVSMGFDKEIKEAIGTYRQDPILKIGGHEKYLSDAKEHYKLYCRKMKVLMRRFDLQNEQEAVFGQPLSWHPLLQGNKGKSEDAIKTAFTDLYDCFRKMFHSNCKTHEEAKKKASAWYQVAYTKGNTTEGYFLGFPWVALEILCDIKSERKVINSYHMEEDLGRSMIELFLKNVPGMLHQIKRNEKIHQKVDEVLIANSNLIKHTEIYGSTSMFLFSNESDIDIFVEPSNNNMNTDQLLGSIVETMGDIAFDVQRSRLNAITPLVKCRISDDDDYYCDLTMNNMGRLKTYFMHSLYEQNPAILITMWNLVRWARNNNIIKSNCTDDSVSTMPAAEFYSMILIATGVQEQKVESLFVLRNNNIGPVYNKKLSDVFSCITHNIRNSSDLAKEVGKYFLTFFRKSSLYIENLHVLWELNQERQNVLIPSALVSSLCKKTLLAAVITRNIDRINEIAQNGVAEMEFVKRLPSILSSALLSSLSFHQTHLSLLSGANVWLEQEQDQSKVLLKASGNFESIRKLQQEIYGLLHSRFVLHFGCPSKKTERYLMDGASLIMMRNIKHDEWMVGYEDYHGFRQEEHLARQTSKIICNSHGFDPTWLCFAQTLFYQRLTTQLQLFLKNKKSSCELSLVARFGVFYVVDASLTLSELHQRISIGELSALLVKNRMYRKGERQQPKSIATYECHEGAGKKIKLLKSDHVQDIENKSRKVATLRRNKNGLASAYVGTLETTRPLDLKLPFKDILKKRGYHQVCESDIRSDSPYFWKIGIVVSRSVELTILLGENGIPGVVRERELKLLHCTILDDERGPKIKCESNIDPRNDIRIVLESTRTLDMNDEFFRFLFPNGILPQKPIVKVENGNPKVVKGILSDNAYKNIYQTRRIIAKEQYSKDFVKANINSGSMHNGSALKQSRLFCDLSLHFDSKVFIDVMDGRQDPEQLEKLTKQVIEESTTLSNDIKMYFHQSKIK